MAKKRSKWHWLKKFGYAFRGFYSSLKEEPSLVVHVIASLIVLILAFILKIRTYEWAIIIVVIAVVIATELINTAIENIVDTIAFEYNLNARKIKDISAAATLTIALASIAVGLVIFIPRIIDFVKTS